MLSGNKEEEYINLVFERIDDASVLSNFYCGIDEMDEFIHNKLQDYLKKTGNWRIYHQSSGKESTARQP